MLRKHMEPAPFYKTTAALNKFKTLYLVTRYFSNGDNKDFGSSVYTVQSIEMYGDEGSSCISGFEPITESALGQAINYLREVEPKAKLAYDEYLRELFTEEELAQKSIDEAEFERLKSKLGK